MSLIPRDFFDSFHDFDNFLNSNFNYPSFNYPNFNNFGLFQNNFRNNYQPPMDIVEKDDGIYATLEVPGMNTDDISIELQNNKLLISGKKIYENKVDKNNYKLLERRSGSFTRSFSVYPNTKTEDITASYKDGILNIKIERKNDKKYIKIN